MALVSKPGLVDSKKPVLFALELVYSRPGDFHEQSHGDGKVQGTFRG